MKKFDPQKLVNGVRSGMTYRAVADTYGCSVTTVYNANSSAGIIRQRKQQRDERIIRLRSETDVNGCPKYSHEQIAELVGCHRQTVGSVLMKQPEYRKNRKAKRHIRQKQKG